jgi:predicted lipoprotein with Yx(FWY)xxD motif
MENMMKTLPSTRLLPLALAFVAALTASALVATAHAKTASRSVTTGTLVNLRKTALGSVLVDNRGRTLYLFEKDKNGMSACASACLSYWPTLTSVGTPRAGAGVHQSLLTLAKAQHGTRQVLYAGHPLYTFVEDKSAGQTNGENLDDFGAEWYAVSAAGAKVEPVKAPMPAATSSSSSGY